MTRAAWRTAAAPGPTLEIEVVCSDTAEHRRRVEIRAPTVPRPVAPKWESVARRGHERWSEPRLVLDTASLGADEAALRVRDQISSRRLTAG